MTMPNSTIFEKLENAKIKTINGPRWLMSDLVNIFHLKWNYHIRPDANIRSLILNNNSYFDQFITTTNARRPNKITGESVADKIIMENTKTIVHDYSLVTPNGIQEMKNGMDAMVNNFVAWATLNPNLPIDGGLFGRIYFMDLGTDYNQMTARHNELSRIFMRRYLADKEKQISGILYRYNINFRDFAVSAHRTFFNNIDSEPLKKMYNISIRKSDPIANYMGHTSLRAKFNAYADAIDKLNKTTMTDPASQFIQTVMRNLYNARNDMIYHGNKTPEQDLSRVSVPQLAKQRTRESVEFIKQHIHIAHR